MAHQLPILTNTWSPEPQPLEDDGAAPPWPHQPTVEWQVCGQCNYDCSYCIQSKKYRVGYPTRDELDAALDFLNGLPGQWEVKMTGGEPFASRLLLDHIVPRLVAGSHTISTLTNLSASTKQLQRFAALTHGRLGIVSASLHLEFTRVPDFIARLELLRDHAHANARFVVNMVLVPDRLAEVAAAKREVEAAGFRWFGQLMKVKRGLHPYTAAQMREVEAIIGDLELATRTRSANMAPAYTGRRCWTGARYLVLLQSGDAWACRTARRHDQGFLGNVVRGQVELRPGPIRCPYSICPCTVPANRGMIEGVAR
ncbi:putative Fe-S oxidoreductase [Enhygromyxa salina]|uniref:Putative Fe-S oxidoreductase n=1 Tax=Enhygromyxa salina TaxID=215803 RepID=A0A0C2CVE3_9BACT|nr:radical SAM protein [Enhygromyxa salina]KIG15076.1 putative Fe-S oxidoreductase [Enhygromyxa salina]